MAKQQQRPQQAAPAQPKKAAPAPVRRTEKREPFFSNDYEAFIFGRQNFIIMGVGLGLVVLGLITMSGGAMPDPNKWEPERIYSFTRITLAPILMVAGFITVIYGIFKKNAEAPSSPASSAPAAE